MTKSQVDLLLVESLTKFATWFILLWEALKREVNFPTLFSRNLPFPS